MSQQRIKIRAAQFPKLVSLVILTLCLLGPVLKGAPRLPDISCAGSQLIPDFTLLVAVWSTMDIDMSDSILKT